MVGVADGCCEDLCFVSVCAECADDVCDEGYAVFGDVVEASDEGAYVCGSCFGCEECLSDGEDECAVGGYASVGEVLDCADAVFGAWEFDCDDGVDGCEAFAFAYHAFVVGGEDFGADAACADDVADGGVVPEDLFVAFDVFFCHERWVGGDAVEYAEGMCFADLLKVGCVDKKLHRKLLVVLVILGVSSGVERHAVQSYGKYVGFHSVRGWFCVFCGLGVNMWCFCFVLSVDICTFAGVIYKNTLSYVCKRFFCRSCCGCFAGCSGCVQRL